MREKELVVKYKKDKQEEEHPEGKTLFEHIGLAGGGKTGDAMQKYKKMGISLLVYIIIGYIIGMILDLMLETEIYAMVLALVLTLLWIVSVFGKYLKPTKK